MSRQVCVDTETTGFDFTIGDRIIEFGAVEIINRRLTGNTLHFYCNPNYKIKAGALAIHGITNDFLLDKPSFEEKVSEMIEFLKDAEVIIHNANFDVSFINWELSLLEYNPWGTLEKHVNKIIDSLDLAKKKHPLQKNNLNALCKRYNIRNNHRNFHGALLDSELLANVYLAMTGGQTHLLLENQINNNVNVEFSLGNIQIRNLSKEDTSINSSINSHNRYLKEILKIDENAW